MNKPNHNHFHMCWLRVALKGSFNNKSLTVSIANWLEVRAGKQGVAGLIPDGGTYFHF